MPRKEYKTITVKVAAFQKFAKAVREAQKRDPSMDNSTFLKLLIARRHKGKR